MKSVKHQLESALARLVANEPTHPSLKERALAGTLQLSISVVAREAGCSRTLIGYENCAYPDVRKLVLEAAARGPGPKVRRDLHKRMTHRVADLNRQLIEQESVQAALVLELERLRSEAERAWPRIKKK